MPGEPGELVSGVEEYSELFAEVVVMCLSELAWWVLMLAGFAS